MENTKNKKCTYCRDRIKGETCDVLINELKINLTYQWSVILVAGLLSIMSITFSLIYGFGTNFVFSLFMCYFAIEIFLDKRKQILNKLNQVERTECPNRYI